MKVTKTINKAENVTAVDFGKLSNLNDYVWNLLQRLRYQVRYSTPHW